MKKSALFFLGLILLTSLVSAQRDPGYIIDSSIRTMESILRPFGSILLNAEQVDEYLFLRFLLLVIVFFLVKIALESWKTLSGQRGIVMIISLAVSLMSVRYLGNNELVRGILLPYSVLGVALTTILPFLIYFLFVHNVILSGVGRRLAWIFFIVVFISMWIYRFSELSTVSNWIYALVLIAAILFFIFDKKVRVYFALAEIQSSKKNINAEVVADLLDKYRTYLRIYNETGSDSALRTLRKYERRLREMGVSSLPGS